MKAVSQVAIHPPDHLVAMNILQRPFPIQNVVLRSSTTLGYVVV